MPKPQRSPAALQKMIEEAVQKYTGFVGIKTAVIHKGVPSTASRSNWHACITDFGKADPEVSREALREVVPILQTMFNVPELDPSDHVTLAPQ